MSHTLRSVLIIPGGGMSADRAEYRWVAAQYRARGFTVVLLRMRWQRYWSSNYVAQVRRAIKKLPGEKHLFGFSWGALAALLAAREEPVAHILACSVSPEIASYRLMLESDLALYGYASKVAERDFLPAIPTVAALGRGMQGSVALLLGEKELLLMRHLAYEFVNCVANSTFTLVRKTGHTIASAEYRVAIRNIIREL